MFTSASTLVVESAIALGAPEDIHFTFCLVTPVSPKLPTNLQTPTAPSTLPRDCIIPPKVFPSVWSPTILAVFTNVFWIPL